VAKFLYLKLPAISKSFVMEMQAEIVPRSALKSTVVIVILTT